MTRKHLNADKQLFISTQRLDYSRSEIETIIRNMGIAGEIDVDGLISAAHDYLDSGDYLCEGDTFDGVWLEPSFWVHFRILTGRTFHPSNADSFFACSC